MRRPLLSRLIVALLAVVPAARATDLARVHLQSDDDLLVLLRAGFDVIQTYKSDPTVELGPPVVDLLLKDGQESALVAMGFQVEILDRDHESTVASRLRPLNVPLGIGPPGYGQGGMGGYYTLDEINQTVDFYVATYPNIVSQKLAVGTTHEGRTIWAIKVSDNPNATENEPRVHFDALHHAREPMSAHTLIWLLHHLCTSYGGDPLVTQLVNSREIWMVPVVNPDGYRYNQTTNPNGGGFWRKNRRNNPGSCDGVDLNRNWPTAWGFDNAGSSPDTCSETYRGPGPASEPEVQALDAFLTGKNFQIAWSMHTFGEWLVEPYGYKSGNPPNSPDYDEYSADIVAFNNYVSGPAYNLLYPANGGAVDHYHDVHGAIAYTPEIGTDFWPPISSAVATAILNLEPGMLMIKYAGTWLVTQNLSLSDVAGGDGDGFAEPGETIDLVAQLRNKGQLATGGPVTLTLGSSSSSVNVTTSSVNVSSMASLTNGSNAGNPLQVQIAQGATPGIVSLDLTYSYAGGSQSEVVPLVIGAPRAILRDNIETDLGWTAGVPSDGATTGAWERGDPAQKTNNSDIAQPSNDATPSPGTICYVTDPAGGSAGTEDVDGGPTTLITPTFDLSAAVDPVVRYQRFFYCDDGDDFLVVDITNNDGQSWINLEDVNGQQNQWTLAEHRVADFIAPSASMRLRFITSDDPNNSVTEALVDDFEVIDYGTAPHLALFGTPGIGGDVELQLAGETGKPWFLYMSLGTGSNTIPGVSGTFGLNPATLFFLFSLPASPSALTRIPVTIPNDPSAVGAVAYLQAIVGGASPALSNVAKVTVTN